MLIGIDGNEANQRQRVGIGQFAYQVIKELAKADQKNSYLIYLKEPPLTDLPQPKVNWRYQVFGPGRLWTQIALPLRLFTQREKIDVFFTPSHYAPRFSPTPTVISIMDLWHHRHPEQFIKRDLYQLTKWEGYSVKKASKIITISEFSKSEILKFYHYPKEKIFVAYPGFTKFMVRDKQRGIRRVKRKYKVKRDYLLYLGTLQPKKNIEGLLEAFSRITDQPSLTLVLAGKKGWLYQNILRKVKELGLGGKVILTGFIEEKERPYLIAGAKLFVFPSFYEGFGIPVLEAMDLSVPVVTSKEASLPEVGGKAALYCDPYSVKDMTRAINKALSLNKKERNEIIKKGKFQVKKFSWKGCAQKILAVLEDH